MRRRIADVFFAAALVTAIATVVLFALGVAIATWPLRRLGRSSPNAAKLAALQEVAAAIAGAVAVIRAGRRA